MIITLTGPIPPKKNGKRVFVRSGRHVVLPSTAHGVWHKGAMLQLAAHLRALCGVPMEEI